METWRLLPWSTGTADAELALAHGLLAGLDSVGQQPIEQPRPALRWYGMSPPALIIGSGQSLEQIDQLACQRAGIQIYRRSSGGSAVLATPDMLMCDLVLPRHHRLWLADVTESYRWFSDIWVATLIRLGVPARSISIAEARSDTQHQDQWSRRVCFAGRSPYEIMTGERKVIGLSQVRRRSGLLIQAGLYLHWHAAAISRLLNIPISEQMIMIERLDQRVTGIHDLGPADVQHTDIMAAFTTALNQHFGMTLEPADWSPTEQEAQHQAHARYAPIR
ncbi:MAG: lipoate--protein ligase family protein [Chloroflexaceae bacterium]|nr:lipoate--protein ligase family protein [Chloroflexaceae bacterium]